MRRPCVRTTSKARAQPYCPVQSIWEVTRRRTLPAGPYPPPFPNGTLIRSRCGFSRKRPFPMRADSHRADCACGRPRLWKIARAQIPYWSAPEFGIPRPPWGKLTLPKTSPSSPSPPFSTIRSAPAPRATACPSWRQLGNGAIGYPISPARYRPAPMAAPKKKTATWLPYKPPMPDSPTTWGRYVPYHWVWGF